MNGLANDLVPVLLVALALLVLEGVIHDRRQRRRGR